MKVAAVIPCRYLSTRFEGKPLVLIGGKPMMWHVYQQATKAASIAEVYIATDDQRIAGSCEEYGLNYLMTRSDHQTGTDRVAECAHLLDADVIVNVQGDEPFIEPSSIDAVTRALLDSTVPGLAASNAYTLIESDEEIRDTSVVKVLFSQSGRAMSYSRLPVPLSFRNPGSYHRQLGLYAFRKEALEFFAKTPQGPLECSESVEMYRFIEHDRPIQMVPVHETGIAVDTPTDLEKAIRFYESSGRSGRAANIEK
ncbi:MAG: 3-deoxy-manno-octulosonate cytidylyltransferase [Luteolibacter sp.]